MKRFFSVILAALMLAQTTAFAAPAAETVENSGESAESAQFLEEEKETIVNTAVLYDGYGTPDTVVNYSNLTTAPSDFFKIGVASQGEISFTADGMKLVYTSGTENAKTLTNSADGTSASHPAAKEAIFRIHVPSRPTSLLSKLVIRVKGTSPYTERLNNELQNDNASALCVYTCTDAHGGEEGTERGLNGSWQQKFAVSFDGKYHDIVFDLTKYGNWEGNLTCLRIDLPKYIYEGEEFIVDSIVAYVNDAQYYDFTDMVFTPANGATDVDYRTRKVTAKLPDGFTGDESVLSQVDWGNLYFNSYDAATKTAVFGINHSPKTNPSTLKGKTFTSPASKGTLADGSSYTKPAYSFSMSDTYAFDGENLVPNGDMSVDTNTMLYSFNGKADLFSTVRNGVLTVSDANGVDNPTWNGINLKQQLVDFKTGTADAPKYYYFSFTVKLTDETKAAWDKIRGTDVPDTNANSPKIDLQYPNFGKNENFDGTIGAYTPGVSNRYNLDTLTGEYQTFSYILKSTSSSDVIVPYFKWQPSSVSNGARLDAFGFDFNNITLKEMYTLDFELGEGVTGTAPETRYYAKNVNTRLPDASGFTKKGYVLAGWTDGENVYKPGSVASLDMAYNTKLEAVWTPMLTLEDESSASVRTEPNGIRLLSGVAAEIKADSKLVSYGYIVARTKQLGENELTFTTDVNYVTKPAYEAGEGGVDYYYQIDDGLIKIAAAIVGIPDDHVNDKFTIRTYADMGDETLYGNSVTTSLTKICKSYKDNEEAYAQLTDAQKELVDEYAGRYVEE